MPILIYTPETHVGAGALGIKLWKSTQSKIPTRTSNAEVVALYTSRNQVIIIPSYTIFTRDEKYRIDGFGEELLGFRDFYFGRGDNTPVSNKERVRYDVIGLENRIGRRIFKKHKIFVGVEIRALKFFNVHSAVGGELDSSKIQGYKGATTMGLGPAITYDSRDNIVNPSKGFLWDTRFSAYSRSFGGSVNYHRLYVDLRKYFNVKPSKRHILALELFGNFVKGDAPFKELSELGGMRIMRGYYRGRYRDNYLTAFQAEYRMPLTQRIGIVGFMGLGKVYNPQEVNLKGIHYSYGTGIRLKINKRENLNLRLDYALGDLSYPGYFYFGFAESF